MVCSIRNTSPSTCVGARPAKWFGRSWSCSAKAAQLNKPSEFFEAVMAREEKASTVANGGVAFPHARTELVEQILLGIGRSRQGDLFDGREKIWCTSFSSSPCRNRW